MRRESDIDVLLKQAGEALPRRPSTAWVRFPVLTAACPRELDVAGG